MIDVTAFAQTLAGKPVAVFGLGISNLAAIAALVKSGVAVTAWDDDPTKLDAARAAGATTHDFTHESLSGYACLVLAPGVHPGHPVEKHARLASIEILCDIEILHRSRHGRRTIGITGTNGKSTTTALIGHILKNNGVPAAVGGNIGHAALALDVPPPDGVFVLELSSYQLQLCPHFAPDIAVLLNITPDHIDHHGTLENYIAAKSNILRGTGHAVISFDDASTKVLAENAQDRTVQCISVSTDIDEGVFVRNSVLHERTRENGEKKFALENPALPGVHNHQNAAAAFAACRALGLSAGDIIAAIRTFPGLAHRQYRVRTINNVTYIDDSKATNAATTAQALACYNDIFWIAGGRSKEGGLRGLEPFMPRIRTAFLIGEAMMDFSVWLKQQGVDYKLCGTLDNAVLQAHEAAQEIGRSATVLLSPACASLDQFRNFEHRGDMFAALVNHLREPKL